MAIKSERERVKEGEQDLFMLDDLPDIKPASMNQWFMISQHRSSCAETVYTLVIYDFNTVHIMSAESVWLWYMRVVRMNWPVPTASCLVLMDSGSTWVSPKWFVCLTYLDQAATANVGRRMVNLPTSVWADIVLLLFNSVSWFHGSFNRKGNLACKKLGVGFWWWPNLTRALHVLWLQLSPPPSSSIAPVKSRIHSGFCILSRSTWKNSR